MKFGPDYTRRLKRKRPGRRDIWHLDEVVISIGGILCCLALMAFLPWETWLRLFVWLAMGLVVYFIHGQSHSVLRNGPAAKRD